MGDGLKLSKDKRHRSSSSIAGVGLEGTRSERKLDVRASIPEVDDQFAIAEARCDDLQQKIDLVKVLKRKRKLKKRSTTRVSETPPQLDENMPFISVRTQLKKKVSQQASRLRRVDVPPPPHPRRADVPPPPHPRRADVPPPPHPRGYLDPATVEQHRMIGQVRGCNQMFRPQQEPKHNLMERQSSPRLPRLRRARADGDAMTTCGEACVQIGETPGVACGDDDVLPGLALDSYTQRRNDSSAANKRPHMKQQAKISTFGRQTNGTKDVIREYPWKRQEPEEKQKEWQSNAAPNRRRMANNNKQQMNAVSAAVEERPVVELFNKSRLSPPPEQHRTSANKRTNKNHTLEQEIYQTGLADETTVTGPLRDSTPSEDTRKVYHRHPRRVKYRSRRYELPTVASQMKQAGMRYYYETGNTSNIPFVVSKSTAPSHNIGVNIQQVLNGLKVQQPLSGIPLTIAHHMGLGHIPNGTRSAVMQTPSLDTREINVIRLGRRLLRLPSYRYMSYNRLLTLYREGDGMVPRFLRAISRPHYFYTSMYNLAVNREDADGATSKGQGGGVDAKQNLAEYASLYREYEQIDKRLKEGEIYEPELERRRDELSKELAAREDHIRRVVQEYRSDGDQVPLRASASTAEDSYRHSTFKLNLGDPQK